MMIGHRSWSSCVYMYVSMSQYTVSKVYVYLRRKFKGCICDNVKSAYLFPFFCFFFPPSFVVSDPLVYAFCSTFICSQFLVACPCGEIMMSLFGRKMNEQV